MNNTKRGDSHSGFKGDREVEVRVMRVKVIIGVRGNKEGSGLGGEERVRKRWGGEGGRLGDGGLCSGLRKGNKRVWGGGE